MADNLTNKQKSNQPRGLPGWMIEPIRQADALFSQAREKDLSGDPAAAELLRDQAEAIYNELEARWAGLQPEAPPYAIHNQGREARNEKST